MPRAGCANRTERAFRFVVHWGLLLWTSFGRPEEGLPLVALVVLSNAKHLASAAPAVPRPVPLGCGSHLHSEASARLRHLSSVVTLSPAKGLIAAAAAAHRLVPLGCRRTGYFPCGESNQSHVRFDNSWNEASLQRRPRPDPPWSGVRRPAICPRQIASVASHPWARTCAPCSRTRLRCSASPTGAEDLERGVATIHPSADISGPAFHGRAFTGWRPFTPREGRMP